MELSLDLNLLKLLSQPVVTLTERERMMTRMTFPNAFSGVQQHQSNQCRDHWLFVGCADAESFTGVFLCNCIISWHGNGCVIQDMMLLQSMSCAMVVQPLAILHLRLLS